jgi:hypothetical protein
MTTTSWFEKNAAAAIASFLRMAARVLGRKYRERVRYDSWLYFESAGVLAVEVAKIALDVAANAGVEERCAVDSNASARCLRNRLVSPDCCLLFGHQLPAPV